MVHIRPSWLSLGVLSASRLASEASYPGDGSPNRCRSTGLGTLSGDAESCSLSFINQWFAEQGREMRRTSVGRRDDSRQGDNI